MRAVRRAWALAFLMAVTVIPANPGMADAHEVFFSELHYDNTGTDTGEAIEVTAPAGMDMSGWSIVLYNGNGGAPYDTANLVGTVPGAGAFTESFSTIQNGSPDGLALVDPSDSVVQFLSYEGTFVAVGGPADGMTSTDIGVEEPFDTPVGQSLKSTAIDASWTEPSPADFAPELIPPSPIFLSELHYDNAGGDTGEFFEIQGPAGTDLDGWSVVFYNGNGGGAYATVDLDGVIDDEADGEGAVAFLQSGIQNGSPDGLALVNPDGQAVEFLSYEGPFAAVGGPADGLTSTDIGVEEPSNTPTGQSLQRIVDTWRGPFEASAGDLNALRISVVQGSDASSALAGDRVVVEGIVVGDFETFDHLAGFFVQEEDADADADSETSEGVFVFNHANDDVSVGDLVRVEGTVVEFRSHSGDPMTMTELSEFVDITTVSSGNPLPLAAEIEFPLVSSSGFEAYEGMLATLPQELTILEYFNFDRFGEVVVGRPLDGQDRLHQPTAVFDPGSPESFALADYNASAQITIDDGRTRMLRMRCTSRTPIGARTTTRC